MEQQDLRLLNSIAVFGSNHAKPRQAQAILDALKLIEGNSERVVCTQGLIDFNQGRFPEAAKSLGEWCEEHEPGAAHSLLAMTLWQWGRKTEAEDFCRQVVSSSNDKDAIAFAQSILDQLHYPN